MQQASLEYQEWKDQPVQQELMAQWVWPVLMDQLELLVQLASQDRRVQQALRVQPVPPVQREQLELQVLKDQQDLLVL